MEASSNARSATLSPHSIINGLDVSGLSTQIDVGQEYNASYLSRLAKIIAEENSNNAVRIYGNTPLEVPESGDIDKITADKIADFIGQGRQDQNLEYPATFLIPILTRGSQHYELMAINIKDRESLKCDAFIIDSSKTSEIDPERYENFVQTAVPIALAKAGLETESSTLKRPLLQYAVDDDRGSVHCGAYVLQNMRNICDFGFDAVVSSLDEAAHSGNREEVERRSLEFRALDLARFIVADIENPVLSPMLEGIDSPDILRDYLPAGVTKEGYLKLKDQIISRAEGRADEDALVEAASVSHDSSLSAEDASAISQELITDLAQTHHNRMANPLLALSESQLILKDFCEIAGSVLKDNPNLNIADEEFKNLFEVKLAEKLDYNQDLVKENGRNFAMFFEPQYASSDSLKVLLAQGSDKDFEEVIAKQINIEFGESDRGLSAATTASRADEVESDSVDDESLAKKLRSEDLFAAIALSHNKRNSNLPLSESMLVAKEFLQIASPILQENSGLSIKDEEFQNIFLASLMEKVGYDESKALKITSLFEAGNKDHLQHLEEFSKIAKVEDVDQIYAKQLGQEIGRSFSEVEPRSAGGAAAELPSARPSEPKGFHVRSGLEVGRAGVVTSIVAGR